MTHMKSVSRLFVLPLALVTMFGAGCGQSSVVQAPTTIVPTAPVNETTPPPAATPTSGWNPIVDQATSTAIAYLSLNGGVATVQRNGEVVVAADGDALSNGDRVSVTAGTVSLIYPNAGETRLKAGADATIVSDSTSTSVFAELRLAAGSAWTRFERLLGTDEHFSVAANGVVATVRGTAFGVTVDGDQADVQVADHFVDVSQEGTESQGVRLQVGEGMRLRASDFVKADLPILRTRIRMLTAAEKADAGFTFALQRLAPERLRVPAQVIHPFRTAPVIRPDLQNRLQLLRSAAIRAGFAAPNRGLLNSEINPLLLQSSSTVQIAPSVGGPAIK